MWHILSLQERYNVHVLYTHESSDSPTVCEQTDDVTYHPCSASSQRSVSSSNRKYSPTRIAGWNIWSRLIQSVRNHARANFDRYPRVVMWPIFSLYVFWRLHVQFKNFRRCFFQLKVDFDLIIANDLDTMAIGTFIRRTNGGILVYDSHENWACVRPNTPQLYKYAMTLYERRHAADADLVTTVSPLLVDHLRNNLRHDQVMLLPNAAPWSPDRECRATSGSNDGTNDRFSEVVSSLAQGRRVATFQGRVTPERGLRELVAAWQFVPEQEVILIIRTPDGPNPELDEVIRIAKANGTFQRTVFQLPSVSEDELILAAKGTDIGIIPYKPTFPNHIMACPNKLSQYMQAGLAIFSNDIPYVRHIVEDAKCGVVYTTDGDSKAIAERITELCRKEEKLQKMKDNSLVYSRTKYNWGKFYFHVEEEIGRLLGDKEA